MTAAATSSESARSGGDQQAFDFKAYLGAQKQLVEAALDDSLGPERPESLREAMRYSCWQGANDCDRSSVWRPVNWRVGIQLWPCPPLWLWR